MPEVYEYLEAKSFLYADRLPSNRVLQRRISHLLTRSVGRPPRYVRRCYFSFAYQAQSWDRARRVVAKIEWHPGELIPRYGLVVTNLSRPAEQVVVFYNRRGTAEQHIKEGKHALKWTRLSCARFAANTVRLQLHALAYNLANFLRTLATPEGIDTWSLTSLRERLTKTGTRLVRQARYAVFQVAEAALPRAIFAKTLELINGLHVPPVVTVSAGPGLPEERRQAAPVTEKVRPEFAKSALIAAPVNLLRAV